jgi:hypothetical protein
MGEIGSLPAENLCWRCTPEQFTFESPEDLEDLAGHCQTKLA